MFFISGAKLSRIVPSLLDSRSFNVDSMENPTSICQTRIVLKDMIDDSNPRNCNFSNKVIPQSEIPVKTFNDAFSSVPRFSVSRKEMSEVYNNEIKNVQENVILN